MVVNAGWCWPDASSNPGQDKNKQIHVGVHLFSNMSQKMSKCSKNISDTFLFLLHFDVLCEQTHSNTESIC